MAKDAEDFGAEFKEISDLVDIDNPDAEIKKEEEKKEVAEEKSLADIIEEEMAANGSEEQETTEEETDAENENNDDDDDDTPQYKKFGYESEVDLYKDFEKYKTQFEEFDKTKGSILAEKKELEEKLNKLKSEYETVNVEDEDILRLAAAKKKEDPNFKLYTRLVADGKDSISEEEAIRLKFLKDMPEYSNDIELLDDFIKDEYGITPPPEGYEKDEEEYKEWERKNKIKQLRLKRDAVNFKNEIETSFKSIEIPKIKGTVSEEESLINKTNAKESWMPYVDDAVKHISNFAIKLEDIGDEPFEFKHEIGSEITEKYKKELIDFVYENSITADKENAGATLTYFRQKFIVENMNDLVKSAVKAAIEKYDALLDNEINPSNKQRRPKGGKLNSIDAQLEAVLRKANM